MSPCALTFYFWQKKESLGEVLELLEKVRLDTDIYLQYSCKFVIVVNRILSVVLAVDLS